MSDDFAKVKETVDKLLALGAAWEADRRRMSPGKFERHFQRNVKPELRFSIRAAMRLRELKVDWKSPESILDAYKSLGLIAGEDGEKIYCYLERVFAQEGIG